MPQGRRVEDWSRFLAALAKNPNVAAACRAGGVNRDTAYARRREDPEFAAAWDAAKEAATDELEGKVWARASSKEGSDQLAIFLLKAHRREVYGDPPKVITQDELDRTIDGIVERLVSAREAKARGEG